MDYLNNFVWKSMAHMMVTTTSGDAILMQGWSHHIDLSILVYEISDRSVQREQFCVQDYARDCGWVAIVYMCVLCAIGSLNNLIQYSYRDQN